MRKGIVNGHARELVSRHAIEGATRAREPDAREVSIPLTNKALVDGAVLRVDGDEPPGLCERHEKVARNNDRLLVGIGQDLVGLERRIASRHAGLAHHSVHHAVNVRELCQRHDGVGAKAKDAARGELIEGNVVLAGSVSNGDVHGIELSSRLDEPLARRVHGKRDYLQAVGMLATHVKRLHTNGARTPENRDAKHMRTRRARSRTLEQTHRIPPKKSMK